MMHPTSSSLSGPQIRNDRSSLELRAYLRSEWKGTPEWIRSPRRSSRPSAWHRFGRWLRSRGAKPEASAVSPVAALPISGRTVAQSRSRETCPHLVVDDLGADLDTTFHRCIACGTVLIVQQGRWWRIVSTLGPTSPWSGCDPEGSRIGPEQVVDA